MHKPGTPKTDVRHETLDPFWNLPEARKKWDLAKLDDQSEIGLGEQLHAMIVQFNPITRDGALQERVFKAAKPLLTKVTRKQIPYSFTILDSTEINAFSHPGGHVYLSRGLLPFIGEEDAVLQFVLAHEIAHVDHQDMIHCLQDPGVQSIDMSTLQKVYFIILPLGYLDQQEFAADQWAYRQLIGLDHTRYECAQVPPQAQRLCRGARTQRRPGQLQAAAGLLTGPEPPLGQYGRMAATRRAGVLR